MSLLILRFMHWFKWNLHHMRCLAQRFKLQFQAAQRAVLGAVPCISVIEDPDETLKGALVYCLINSHLIKAVASVWKCVWFNNHTHFRLWNVCCIINFWHIYIAFGFVVVATYVELDKHCQLYWFYFKWEMSDKYIGIFNENVKEYFTWKWKIWHYLLSLMF